MNNAAVSNFQRTRPLSVEGGIFQNILQSTATRITVLFLAHAFLAVLMIQSSAISTAHALLTVAAGLWIAATSRTPERVVYAIAYITGAEVLWRMTKAIFFYEGGKYAVVAVIAVAILRSGQFRGFALPFLLFALLLPSLVMPMANVSLEELRGQASFNLSGPFAMMFCIWYFSQVRLQASAFYRTFLFLTAPIVGVGTVTLVGIFSASALRFGNESNFATSGGFGPNQVSAILGLGVLGLFLYLLLERKNPVLKPILFVTLLFLAAQSAITFSRTGLYNAALSSLAATLYLVRDSRARFKLIGVVIMTFLIANFLVLPLLDGFTGGSLTKRFQSTSLTGRDVLIRADLNIWADNPIFGVGPGGAVPLRAASYREAAAHTEFTRLVAEHGVFGFASMILMGWIALRNLRRARSAQAKAIIIAITIWSIAFMAVTAMRLAAPAVLFGIGSIMLMLEDPTPHLQERYRAIRN